MSDKLNEFFEILKKANELKEQKALEEQQAVDNTLLQDVFASVASLKQTSVSTTAEEIGPEQETSDEPPPQPTSLKDLFISVVEMKKHVAEQPPAVSEESVPTLKDLFTSVAALKNKADVIDVAPLESAIVETEAELVSDVDELQTVLDKVSEIEAVVENLNNVPAAQISDLEKKFLRVFDKLQKDFQNLKQYVASYQQATVINNAGGGGEVRIARMDDIDMSLAADGKFLKYNEVTQKFDFEESPITTTQAIAALQTQTDANTTAIADLQANIGSSAIITTIQNDIALLQTNVTSNTNDITVLQNNATSTAGDITIIQNNVTNVQNDITNIQTDVTNIQTDVTNVRNRITIVENNVTNLNVAVTTNTTEITNLTSTVATTNVNVANIQNQINNIIQESDMAFSKRIDFISDYLIYRGEAQPGSSEADPVWRVRKITISPGDGDVTETWASGSTNFTNTWTDRLTYTYS